MKKFVLFKNNTSWLPSLLVASLCTGTMFVLSLIVLIVDIAYTQAINKYGSTADITENNINFNYDVIVYPISFVLSIMEIIMAIYLCFNIPIWWKSLSKSIGERKTFNTVFFYPATLMTVLILIDGLIRFFYVVAYASQYFKVAGVDTLAVINISKEGILGNFDKTKYKEFGNFGFNSLILLIISLAFFCYSTAFYFLQKIKFKSEKHENSKKEVQDYYRNLEKEKIRKELNKNKPRDLSKRIRSF